MSNVIINKDLENIKYKNDGKAYESKLEAFTQ